MAGASKRRYQRSDIGRADSKDLYMSISSINPVVDCPARKDADFNAPSDGICFGVIGIIARERTDLFEQINESITLRSWQGVQESDHLKVNEESILHRERLFGMPFLQVVQFDPMIWITVVNFSGQLLPELFILR